MPRLTRAEQQDRTHERLLAAGRETFIRRGFLAATLEEVAAEAGYTRGAVYKHFGGKEGLWLAIVEAHEQAHLRFLEEALDRAGDRAGLLAALAGVTFAADDEAARWSIAAAEFAAAAARRPETASAVVAAQRRLEDEITALLDAHCRRLGVRPAMPADRAVVVLGALSGSLALRRRLDPGLDAAAVAAQALAALFPETT